MLEGLHHMLPCFLEEAGEGFASLRIEPEGQRINKHADDLLQVRMAAAGDW
ncbi:hypothetical protein PATA110616_22265 [Paenibacillus tarimensis]